MKYEKVIDDIISYVLNANKNWIMTDILSEDTCEWSQVKNLADYIIKVSQVRKIEIENFITNDVYWDLEEEIKCNLYRGGKKFMYINGNEKERDFFEDVIAKDDETKLKLITYLYFQIKNGLINSKNSVDLNDDNLDIFEYKDMGMNVEEYEEFLESLITELKIITKVNYNVKENYIENIKYSKIDIALQSKFERLDFKEKLNMIAELFVRLGNESLFVKEMVFNEIGNGFELGKYIIDYRDRL